MDSSYTLCYAAKWLDDPEVDFASVVSPGPKTMLRRVHKLLDQADAVVTYNGDRFDLPTLNKEFLLHGMAPPSPYKSLDLLKVCRNRFRFPSNKLDYVADALGVGKKHKHEGHELWVKCMNKDREAWEVMEKYNRQDVVLLENVYEVVLPWIKTHASYSAFRQDLVCPNCGGTHYQRRGSYITGSNKYQRYQCQTCSTWFRDNTIDPNKATRFQYAR